MEGQRTIISLIRQTMRVVFVSQIAAGIDERIRVNRVSEETVDKVVGRRFHEERGRLTRLLVV